MSDGVDIFICSILISVVYFLCICFACHICRRSRRNRPTDGTAIRGFCNCQSASGGVDYGDPDGGDADCGDADCGDADCGDGDCAGADCGGVDV